MKRFKLGKKPARKHAKRLFLSKYLNRSVLKIDRAPNRDFGMAAMQANQSAWTDYLGNDKYGCCFWAAAYRALMAKLASEGKLPAFDPIELRNQVIEAYSIATGFNENDPSTDRGTDALEGMHYMQNDGLVLPDGSIHKIGSFAWVNPQDYELLLLAHNLFDGLMLGLEFPGAWEDDPVWDLTDSPVDGGHEVFGYSDITPQGITLNTWGKARVITPAAIRKYGDEIAVVISPEMFGEDGKSIAGFDAEQLTADEEALRS